jgi:hypothetical protein
LCRFEALGRTGRDSEGRSSRADNDACGAREAARTRRKDEASLARCEVQGSKYRRTLLTENGEVLKHRSRYRSLVSATRLFSAVPRINQKTKVFITLQKIFYSTYQFNSLYVWQPVLELWKVAVAARALAGVGNYFLAKPLFKLKRGFGES